MTFCCLLGRRIRLRAHFFKMIIYFVEKPTFLQAIMNCFSFCQKIIERSDVKRRNTLALRMRSLTSIESCPLIPTSSPFLTFKSDTSNKIDLKVRRTYQFSCAVEKNHSLPLWWLLLAFCCNARIVLLV